MTIVDCHRHICLRKQPVCCPASHSREARPACAAYTEYADEEPGSPRSRGGRRHTVVATGTLYRLDARREWPFLLSDWAIVERPVMIDKDSKIRGAWCLSEQCLDQACLFLSGIMAIEDDEDRTVPGPAIQPWVVVKFLIASACMVATPASLFFLSLHGFFDGAWSRLEQTHRSLAGYR